LKNRPLIEAELSRNPMESLHWLYFDLPLISQCIRGEGIIKQIYYYVWHLGIYFLARHHHQRVHFDLCHHLTWGRYWAPNLISLLPIPFVWGPVGGGDCTSKAFWQDLGWKGRWQERFRDFVRWLGEHDPFLRMTAKKTTIGLSTTRATVSRLKYLGVKQVEYFPYQVGINQEEFDYLSNLKFPNDLTIRFISIGRLLPWKGLHLSLCAFALAKLEGAELFVVGDGADRKRLEDLAKQLKISQAVKFWEGLSRGEAWQRLEQCHVLVHPCLRGLMTTACIEAMAAGRPIISLKIGQGNHPALTRETGFRIDGESSAQAVNDMAIAMVKLAEDPALLERMGKAARAIIASTYLWNRTARLLYAYYQKSIQIHEGVSIRQYTLHKTVI
jgi:glycosyltransferase involved in cell wall biosynthesis